jgi:hypothetical protein
MGGTKRDVSSWVQRFNRGDEIVLQALAGRMAGVLGARCGCLSQGKSLEVGKVVQVL